MSKVHISRQGYIGKNAIPSIIDYRYNTTNAYSLIIGDGPNNSTAIVDTSVNAWSVSRFNNPLIKTATSPSFETSSINFNGTTQWLTVNLSAGGPLSTSTWTVECFCNFDTIGLAEQAFFGCGNNEGIYISNNGNNFGIISVGGTRVITMSSPVVAGQWYHFAVVRLGELFYFYRDGVLEGVTSYANFGTSGFTFLIARRPGSIPWYFGGYISNFRLTQAALYNGPFSVPTSRLTPTFNLGQDNNMMYLGEGSNGSTTITDSSLYNRTSTAFGNCQISTAQFPDGMTSSISFDGTNSYFSTPVTVDCQYARAFTIDFWFYCTSSAATQQVVALNSVVASGISAISITFPTTRRPQVQLSGNGTSYSVTMLSSTAFALNTWNHFSINRNSGGALVMYLNGTSVATASNSTILYYSTTGTESIFGATSLNTLHYSGYLSNIRVLNGNISYNFAYPNNLPPRPLNNPSAVLGTTTQYGVIQNY